MELTENGKNSYKEIFSRSELLEQISVAESGKSLSTYNFRLNDMLDSNEIVRVGRNKYCYERNKKKYSYVSSPLSEKVRKVVSDKYPEIEFKLFELFQLNEFLNHLIAHNTLFVSVEGMYSDDIFELLKDRFPGRVLLKPTVKEYYLYWKDSLIVVNKLITEAPKNKKEQTMTVMEKLLVDIIADKVIRSIYSESEYPEILNMAFEKYAIDETTLLRYASRRNVKDKILQIIENETDINLRTGITHVVTA